MNIAHFNTYPYGGAAVAAIRIHRGIANLSEPSLNSRFYYSIDDRQITKDPPAEQSASTQVQDKATDLSQLNFSTPSPLGRSIEQSLDKLFFRKRRRQRLINLHQRHLEHRSKSMETFSMAEQFDSAPLPWSQLQADLVHLHWIAFMADYPSFFRSIPQSIPIVWTLHDMNPFTGGCHYADACVRFTEGCGGCPQLVDPHPSDASYWSWRAKQKALRNRRLAVVSPSDWLKEKAEKSQVWPSGTTFHTIRYGLDLQQFYPVEKMEARRQLGLAADRFLIAFGAEDVSNPRKGFEDLCQCLREVQRRSTDFDAAISNTALPTQVEGLVFGSGQLNQETGVRLNQLGYLSDIQQLRQVYSAADVVIVPSIEDNQPQVALEAMACGKPVIASDSSGIPEIVQHGQSGWLATEPMDMAEGIMKLIDSPELTGKLGKRARQWMEQEFEIQQQSQKYLELYRGLIKGASNEPKRRSRQA